MGRPLSLIWFRRFNHTNKVFLFQYPNLHKLFYALLDIDQFNFFQSIVLYNQDKEKIKQERRKKICQDN